MIAQTKSLEEKIAELQKETLRLNDQRNNDTGGEVGQLKEATDQRFTRLEKTILDLQTLHAKRAKSKYVSQSGFFSQASLSLNLGPADNPETYAADMNAGTNEIHWNELLDASQNHIRLDAAEPQKTADITPTNKSKRNAARNGSHGGGNNTNRQTGPVQVDDIKVDMVNTNTTNKGIMRKKRD
eukprot:TRINITY_DN13822_c0_g1_i6.p1 TRINITY_DN13822_c0_g1~~TRINITY_DN13822_c0_g1_i6.p1  ORF type:complete len:184 (+),score=20.30 TRINITY_DN13822_c0_g1_i6:145-696(+)